MIADHPDPNKELQRGCEYHPYAIHDRTNAPKSPERRVGAAAGRGYVCAPQPVAISNARTSRPRSIMSLLRSSRHRQIASKQNSGPIRSWLWPPAFSATRLLAMSRIALMAPDFLGSCPAGTLRARDAAHASNAITHGGVSPSPACRATSYIPSPLNQNRSRLSAAAI